MLAGDMKWGAAHVCSVLSGGWEMISTESVGPPLPPLSERASLSPSSLL